MERPVPRSPAGAVNRARLLAKTHCPKGHAYDAANTAVRASYRTGLPMRQCKACAAEKARRAYAADVRAGRSRAWASFLRTRYGLTVGQYDALFRSQLGLCAICRREQPPDKNGHRDRLAVDHDHATNEVRGLLCHRCNHLLGKTDDDPARLRRAADYLERARPFPRARDH